MPTLTTLRIGLPVWPRHSSERTRSEKAAIRSSVSCTCLTTSSPSTTRERPRGIRSATCSTARSSETLMCSPRNIAARRVSTPRWWARPPSSITVSSLIRFFEKSRERPAPSGASRSPRSGSAAKRSRRCASRIFSKWACSSCQACVSCNPLIAVPFGRYPAKRNSSPGGYPALRLDRLQHLVPGLVEALFALLLEARRQGGDVDPGLDELGQDLLCVAPIFWKQVLNLTVVGEGFEGRLGHRVDRERGSEGLDVEGVGRIGILGSGARPEQALRARTLVHQAAHPI